MESVQVQAGDVVHQINDQRIIRMILWLVKNEQLIAHLERGRAELHFSGRESPSVKYSLTMFDEN